VAVAQSTEEQDQASKSSQVQAPRDAASGQASGKRMHKPQNTMQREAGTGKASGKTMAQDDSQGKAAASSSEPQSNDASSGDGNGQQPAGVRESPSKASTGLRESPSKASPKLRESPSKPSQQVSAGDVDGDGVADEAAAKDAGQASEQPATINTSHSNIKAPRDAASGQATGKRQHKPVKIVKEYETGSKK
jgi:hypothetical protein